MRIVPSIDLDRGRSRIVYWPGAATGVGAPTDQPARIARGIQNMVLVHGEGDGSATALERPPQESASKEVRGVGIEHLIDAGIHGLVDGSLKRA